MKKELRVKTNEEFQKIITCGKCKTSHSFVMCYYPTEKERDRIGISVGKKIGNAVIRNKVKRQVRMMVQQSCNFKTGYDYIFIVRTNYLKFDYQKNKNDLSRLYNSVYNR
ncbi:MAG TPA: ribonuclease P protein component [Erysipelotrichaceae bacterium]|jgi:ribonuclease P protein component|nr:ribonuclease P protein component [Erysipelotrichia bacterium]HPX33104.1 ribonuclease P protein component [Erysipelotrichaceae bacterium]HQA84384.1 ribonuclease P protein component [Erysipelotrichaceae bacterium]